MDEWVWAFTTKQVAHIIGVPYRTLDRWVRGGILPKPTIPATGCGSTRVWSLVDTALADVVSYLRTERISLSAAKEAVEILGRLWREAEQDPMAETCLLFADGRVYPVPDATALIDVLQSEKPSRVLYVDIAEVVEATLQKIADVHHLALGLQAMEELARRQQAE